jgi:hypothetical protein
MYDDREQQRFILPTARRDIGAITRTDLLRSLHEERLGEVVNPRIASSNET